MAVRAKGAINPYPFALLSWPQMMPEPVVAAVVHKCDPGRVLSWHGYCSDGGTISVYPELADLLLEGQLAVWLRRLTGSSKRGYVRRLSHLRDKRAPATPHLPASITYLRRFTNDLEAIVRIHYRRRVRSWGKLELRRPGMVYCLARREPMPDGWDCLRSVLPVMWYS